MIRTEINDSEGAWTSADFERANGGWTAAERYIIEKMANKPTLSAALDNLYRRNPRRWHRLLVAVNLVRREQEGV